MKIICIGRNYVAHALELGNEVPEEPVVFMKPSSSLVKPSRKIMYPFFTNELHYECELVIKIAQNGAMIAEKAAHNFYSQVTLGIDFTARDLQNELKAKGLPWEKAKAFDNSAVVGDWVNKSELPHIQQIEFTFFKNGELVQKGQTELMIFSVNRLIESVSQYFSLNIGDLLFTGTPKGVGECLPGDLLEGYIGNKKVLQVEIK